MYFSAKGSELTQCPFNAFRALMAKTYLNRSLRPVATRIAISNELTWVGTGGRCFQIRQYRACRGGKFGFGSTPEQARKALRYNERKK